MTNMDIATVLSASQPLSRRFLETGCHLSAAFRKWISGLGLVMALLLGCFSGLAQAGISLAWDANTEPDIAGYRIYYGSSSGNYTVTVDVGNTTVATLANLQTDQTYFFVVTAYDTAGVESLPSNEVNSVPAFNVTPSAGANGGISPNTAQTVSGGGSATFTATPNTGYAVNQWVLNGTPVQTGGTGYTVGNVTGSRTVQVTFKLASVQYTVTPSAGANGGISPNRAQTVSSGGSATFTATPNTGYAVDQWLVNGATVQTGGTGYTVSNVTGGTTVQVTFKLLIYAVTPSAGANGGISPNTAQTVGSGGSATFTATPNTGYAVDQWLVNGATVQTGGTGYTVGNVTGSRTVQVTFKLLTYAVTPSVGANGSISPNTAQTVSSGGSATFTATPNTGYAVDQWLLNGATVQTGGTGYTVGNVTGSRTVQVTFKLASVHYTVTPSTGVNGSISPNTAQTVSSGGSATFTATPNTGYTVNQWVLNGTPVQTGGTGYTVGNVTADTTVEVSFKVTVARDFNNDGNTDLVFQNNAGQVATWHMNGSGSATSSAYLSSRGLGDWKVVGVADMNGDGNADLLFQNNPGQVAVWYMNGSGSYSSSAYISTAALGDWKIVGVADMNGDGNADLLFQNNAGQIAVWYMNGSGRYSSNAYISTTPLGDWKIVGVADMNGDGNADLLFQNNPGQIAVWYMNGSGSASSSTSLYSGGLGDWRVKCAADLNGDGKTDLLFQNNAGQIAVWYMNGSGSASSSTFLYSGSLGDWRLR